MVKVYVEGMMCTHCAKRVEDALAGIGCIATVDLKEKCAIIADGDVPPDAHVKTAVEGAGYAVRAIERA